MQCVGGGITDQLVCRRIADERGGERRVAQLEALDVRIAGDVVRTRGAGFENHGVGTFGTAFYNRIAIANNLDVVARTACQGLGATGFRPVPEVARTEERRVGKVCVSTVCFWW